MNRLKTVALFTIPLALLASTAGASANTLTSQIGTPYTGTIKAQSEGTILLHGPFTTVSCESTIEGKVEQHGAGVTVAGKVASLAFAKCNYPVKVLNAGSLEIHALAGGKGTVTSSNAEITIETSIAICLFKTSGTDIGTLTDSSITGENARLDIEGASIPRTGHSFFCGSSGTLTGSYKVTTPSALYTGHVGLVDPSPLTSPAGTAYTGAVKAEAEGAISLDGEFETVNCQKSAIEGKVESHSWTSAAGKVSNLTFGECNYPVKVLEPGSLEIHSIGGGKSTVTSTGALITVDTSVATCLFQTWGTDIGSLTDSGLTGGNATLDTESATIPRIGHSFFCGSSGTLTGSYKVTTPSALYLGHPARSRPLTSPAGTTYTGTVIAQSGQTTLDGAFTSVSCGESNVEGKLEQHGTGVTVGGKVLSLTFANCNFPVKVLKPGSLEIHSLGGGKGTVTSSGAEITIQTSVGNCIFTTASTDIGTLTDTSLGGGNATLDLGGAVIPRTGHTALCGETGKWTGSYKVTSPSTLYLD
jgi:hypothetical protein